jgi:hypothetical protein
MTRLAAAITMPVTNVARQENNSNSFRILMAIGAPYAAPSSPLAHANTLAKK